MAGPNLVSNSTFDSDVAGWTAQAGRGSIAHDAGNGGQLRLTNDLASAWANAQYACTTEIGIEYTFKCEVRAGSVVDSQLQVENGSGVDLSNVDYTTAGVKTITFVATTTTSLIKLYLNEATANSGNHIFFDNIEMYDAAANPGPSNGVVNKTLGELTLNSQPPSTWINNLILNGEFPTTVDNWTDTVGRGTGSSIGGRLAITNDLASNNPNMYQDFATEIGVEYSVEALFDQGTSTVLGAIQVKAMPADTAIIASATIASGVYENTFVATTTLTRIKLYNNDVGQNGSVAYWDDVKVWDPLAVPEPFTIAHIGDTQLMVADATDGNGTEMAKYEAMVQWLKDNKVAENIKLIVHTGDLNDNYAADTSEMLYTQPHFNAETIDGIPLMITTGNHDLAGGSLSPGSEAMWETHFPDTRYTSAAEYVAQYASGKSLNYYYKITYVGIDYLIFSLELNPRINVLNWVGGIADANPAAIVIVGTHSVIDDTGASHETNINVQDYETDQWGDANLYNEGTYGNEARCNGAKQWTYYKQHANILLTLCGHNHDYTGVFTDTNDAGNTVTHIQNDYSRVEVVVRDAIMLIAINPETRMASTKVISAGAEFTGGQQVLSFPMYQTAAVGIAGTAANTLDALTGASAGNLTDAVLAENDGYAADGSLLTAPGGHPMNSCGTGLIQTDGVFLTDPFWSTIGVMTKRTQAEVEANNADTDTTRCSISGLIIPSILHYTAAPVGVDLITLNAFLAQDDGTKAYDDIEVVITNPLAAFLTLAPTTGVLSAASVTEPLGIQTGNAESDLEEGITIEIDVLDEIPKKGPYLIYPGTNTEMMVLWQLDATQGCVIEWGTDRTYAGGSQATTEYGVDHQHTHTITGLTPGVKYYYNVQGLGSGDFYAAPPESDVNLKFLAYGDTRSFPADQNEVLAQAINTYKSNPAFQTIMLHVGDWINVDTEADWDTQFFPPLDNLLRFKRDIPINGTIGNHEGSGAVYEKYYPYPYEAGGGNYYSFTYGPMEVFVLDQYNSGGVNSLNAGSAQYIWLEAALTASTKPWKVIQLHAPGWSAGLHPNSEAEMTAIRTHIHPLCVTHDVLTVFGGHNHYYARAEVDGVSHLTIGGGGAPSYEPAPPLVAPVAVTSLGAELVLNGTLDTLTSWVTYPTRGAAEIDGSVDKGNRLRLTNNLFPGYPKVSQEVPTVEGTTYQLTVDADAGTAAMWRAKLTSDTVPTEVLMTDGFRLESNMSGTFTAQFVALAGAFTEIELVLQEADGITDHLCWFDNVSIKEVVAGVANYGTNLIPKGDFETDLVGWTHFATRGTAAIDAGRLKITNDGVDSWPKLTKVSIPVESGKTYRFGGIIDVGTSPSVQIKIKSGAAAELGIIETTVSGTIYDEATAVDGFFEIQLYNNEVGNTGSEVWFDDIVIQEVLPASMIMGATLPTAPDVPAPILYGDNLVTVDKSYFHNECTIEGGTFLNVIRDRDGHVVDYYYKGIRPSQQWIDEQIAVTPAIPASEATGLLASVGMVIDGGGAVAVPNTQTLGGRSAFEDVSRAVYYENQWIATFGVDTVMINPYTKAEYPPKTGWEMYSGTAATLVLEHAHARIADTGYVLPHIPMERSVVQYDAIQGAAFSETLPEMTDATDYALINGTGAPPQLLLEVISVSDMHWTTASGTEDLLTITNAFADIAPAADLIIVNGDSLQDVFTFTDFLVDWNAAVSTPTHWVNGNHDVASDHADWPFDLLPKSFIHPESGVKFILLDGWNVDYAQANLSTAQLQYLADELDSGPVGKCCIYNHTSMYGHYTFSMDDPAFHAVVEARAAKILCISHGHDHDTYEARVEGGNQFLQSGLAGLARGGTMAANGFRVNRFYDDNRMVSTYYFLDGTKSDLEEATVRY